MSSTYIIYLIIYLLILYVVGFISNYEWRGSEDILYLNRDQWISIILVWIPVFIGGFIK